MPQEENPGGVLPTDALAALRFPPPCVTRLDIPPRLCMLRGTAPPMHKAVRPHLRHFWGVVGVSGEFRVFSITEHQKTGAFK